jgi:diguanylate cyclase (GGDEF)-like protein
MSDDPGPQRPPGATPPPTRRPPAPTGPYLVVVTGPYFGDVFDLPAGRALTLGRAPGCDAVLDDETVAPRHASVEAAGAGARLADLGSQSGTFVDGVRVAEAELRDGARFHLGPHTALKLVASNDVEASYQRKLVQGALHEPLTGLFNRRHFTDRLVSEIAAAQRRDRPLALLAVDVDQLGRVNELHGLPAGDQALRTVAEVLQGVVRKEDVVGRYAGEQFLVVARETGAPGAAALAERIRRAIERSRTEYGDEEIALTASVGVAVVAGAHELGAPDPERRLMRAAEQALAAAKKAGRNRVAAAPVTA